MAGKLPKTLEFIRTAFSEVGFTLLSTTYINKNQLLDYVCSNGHQHKISWHGFRQGNRCPYCSNKVKKTYEEISLSFSKENYVLISTDYVNAHVKLDYICSNGHSSSMTWANFQQGKRCGYCAGNKLLLYNNVEKLFSDEGYTLISKEYKNSTSKLTYQCNLGHEHTTTLANFSYGYRCPTCAYIRQCGENHWNWCGGYSKKGYCSIWSDKEFKIAIKLRDNNICQNPYCYKIDTRLHVHHIDYNKKNCHPNNLITLCGSCNAKANYEREWHINWYQTILKNRFN